LSAGKTTLYPFFTRSYPVFTRFNRHRLYHILPSVIATISILVLLQTHASREDKIIVFVKGMSFACLSLAWIYIKGIHQVTQAMHNLF